MRIKELPIPKRKTGPLGFPKKKAAERTQRPSACGAPVLAEAGGEDDAREGTLQCLAREILHLHAGLTRDLLPDLDLRLRHGNPRLLPVVLERNIRIAAGVHRFHYFP